MTHNADEINAEEPSVSHAIAEEETLAVAPENVAGQESPKEDVRLVEFPLAIVLSPDRSNEALVLGAEKLLDPRRGSQDDDATKESIESDALSEKLSDMTGNCNEVQFEELEVSHAIAAEGALAAAPEDVACQESSNKEEDRLPEVPSAIILSSDIVNDALVLGAEKQLDLGMNEEEDNTPKESIERNALSEKLKEVNSCADEVHLEEPEVSHEIAEEGALAAAPEDVAGQGPKEGDGLAGVPSAVISSFVTDEIEAEGAAAPTVEKESDDVRVECSDNDAKDRIEPVANDAKDELLNLEPVVGKDFVGCEGKSEVAAAKAEDSAQVFHDELLPGDVEEVEVLSGKLEMIVDNVEESIKVLEKLSVEGSLDAYSQNHRVDNKDQSDREGRVNERIDAELADDGIIDPKSNVVKACLTVGEDKLISINTTTTVSTAEDEEDSEDDVKVNHEAQPYLQFDLDKTLDEGKTEVQEVRVDLQEETSLKSCGSSPIPEVENREAENNVQRAEDARSEKLVIVVDPTKEAKDDSLVVTTSTTTITSTTDHNITITIADSNVPKVTDSSEAVKLIKSSHDETKRLENDDQVVVSFSDEAKFTSTVSIKKEARPNRPERTEKRTSVTDKTPARGETARSSITSSQHSSSTRRGTLDRKSESHGSVLEYLFGPCFSCVSKSKY